MPRRVAVDSGPLVALFDRNDDDHTKAREFIRRFRGELFSNVAVVTETLYLLDFSAQAQLDFLAWATSGALSLLHLHTEDLIRATELMRQYADLPADFADVSLVVLCERLGTQEVASVDRDFSVYRLHGKKAIKNVF
jgi:hypothetical protein